MAWNRNHQGAYVHICLTFGLHVVVSQKATDRDTGENRQIKFQVIFVRFVGTNVNDKPEPTDLIFEAETEPPDTEGNYRGIIK